MSRLLGVVSASILLSTACGTETELAEVGDEVPTLQVLAPEPGEAVETPFELHYEVSGFALGPPPDGHIHVIWGDPETEMVMVFPDEQSGSIEVEGVPEGTHDLTIALAHADHSLPDNPEASVTVESLQVAAPAAAPEPEPAPTPVPAQPQPEQQPQQAPPPQPAPQQPAPQQPAPPPAPDPTPEPYYEEEDPGVPGY